MPAEPSDWPYSQSPYVNRDGPFPAPAAAELAEFERLHSLALPEAYRSFLVTFTGGPPEGCHIRVKSVGEDLTLREVYPLRSTRDADGEGAADLDGVVNWDEFFPRDLLAFADDGCGNWFCIGVRGEVSGKVFFVDHEYERGEARHLVKVADSFDAFKGMWKSPDPPG